MRSDCSLTGNHYASTHLIFNVLECKSAQRPSGRASALGPGDQGIKGCVTLTCFLSCLADHSLTTHHEENLHLFHDKASGVTWIVVVHCVYFVHFCFYLNPQTVAF